MLLLELVVDNFGIFEGRHSFALTNPLTKNHKRSVVLFQGHNGAGKTTIFQALPLALYGAAYFGDPSDAQKYQKFIQGRIHHSNGGLVLDGIYESGVALSFQLVLSGHPTIISIERRWKLSTHNKLQETLFIHQDNQVPDVDPSDYQAWIDDLIPLGIGELCFFDAEQLDMLVNADQLPTFRNMFNRLLGLDWAQRLEADLGQFMNRQGSTKKIESLYTRTLELQVERDRFDNQLRTIQDEHDKITADVVQLDETLFYQERLLAAEGGAYAARRPVLQQRLQEIQKEIESLSQQLHDLCANLLPFALVPELGVQVYKRLLAENKLRHQQVLNALLHERLPELEEVLVNDTVWEEFSIEPKSRKQLTHYLLEKVVSLGTHASDENMDVIHSLSEQDQQRLTAWVRQVLGEVPKNVQHFGKNLRKLRHEQHRINADLQRAPDDTLLIPIHDEITRLRGNLNEKRKRLDALKVQIGQLQLQRNEKQRALKEVIEHYDKVRNLEKQLMYAQQSRNVLRTYKDVLTQQKLHAFEKALVECFNKICRKEYLLTQVRIDPETFHIYLEGKEGNALDIKSFSAGEKQLYALSILWALRLTSQRALPLAIDTPLARLDETHRLRLVQNYFSLVSDQVSLFVTDAEVESPLTSEISPYLLHYYQLNYDADLGQTRSVHHSLGDLEDSALITSHRKEVDIYGI